MSEFVLQGAQIMSVLFAIENNYTVFEQVNDVTFVEHCTSRTTYFWSKNKYSIVYKVTGDVLLYTIAVQTVQL